MRGNLCHHRKMWKLLVWWWKILKQYLGNCSIHGVRYLVDNQFTYVERLFWLVACALCWWGCANMIIGVIDEFVKNPVAVTAETLYLDWQTPFPTVGFCISSTSAMRNRYFKTDPSFSNYSYESASNATAEELLRAYEEIKVPCSVYLRNCEWNRVKFNCCEEFLPLYKTGVGHCLFMNSYHVQKDGKPRVRFFLNRTEKYGDLIVDISSDKSTKTFFPIAFLIYLFGNYEIPSIISSEDSQKLSLKAGKTTRVDFNVKGVFNEDGVRSVPINSRNCRFSDEVHPSSMFPIYSSSLCDLEVIIYRMIKYCGCVHFYYEAPKNARTCNMRELQCILERKSDILYRTPHKSICVPDCDRPVIDIARFEPSGYDSPSKKYVRIHFSSLAQPSLRYRRYVVNDILDVVVSVGSALGLFVGASILSVFEIPYWLFIRRDRIV